jgi:hypothetical protein
MKNTKQVDRIRVVNPVAWIEDLFKNFKRPAHYDWPFDFLVLVSGRIDSPGPRDEKWEYILDLGMPKIEKVLARKPIGAGPHFFIFPDRWLTPPEAVQFGHALKHNPDAAKFGRVYVVTHQPYIVGDCHREQVLILRKES